MSRATRKAAAEKIARISTRRQRILLGLGLALPALVACSGAITAISNKALLKGHDNTSYAVLLNDAHDNISHGILVPLWGQARQFGYGEPSMESRPPLQTYLTELSYLATGHRFVALTLPILFFFAAAALGMYLLATTLVRALSPEDAAVAGPWPALFASTAYVLSPYFLTDVYVRAAYSESSTFPVLPWLGLAFLRLAREPGARNLAIAGFACAALAGSHAAITLLTLPFLFAALLVFRQHVRGWLHLMGAVVLGMAATSFYWAAALGESKYVKAAIQEVDFHAYPVHFVRLDQVIHTPWIYPFGDISFGAGAVVVLGMFWAFWQWASREPGDSGVERQRLLHLLLAFCAASIYMMHRVSAVWYETLPWLQLMTFPWRFLTSLTFFGTLLAMVGLLGRSLGRKHWLVLAGAMLFLRLVSPVPWGLDTYPEEEFSPETIMAHGWGLPVPLTSSSTASILPKAKAEKAVEVLRGRADPSCARQGPNLMSCSVLAIQASLLRFNQYDFPGWKTFVDGKPAATAGRDPLWGTLIVSIPPGKHEVRWELTDTPLRAATKTVSLLAILALLALLFQDQLVKAKALLPKRDHGLEGGAAAQPPEPEPLADRVR